MGSLAPELSIRPNQIRNHVPKYYKSIFISENVSNRYEKLLKVRVLDVDTKYSIQKLKNKKQ